MALAVQRSFDDLGVALIDATFCVFDLETTGGAPDSCRITEIGAVKVRAGEVLGESRRWWIRAFRSRARSRC